MLLCGRNTLTNLFLQKVVFSFLSWLEEVEWVEHLWWKIWCVACSLLLHSHSPPYAPNPVKQHAFSPQATIPLEFSYKMQLWLNSTLIYSCAFVYRSQKSNENTFKDYYLQKSFSFLSSSCNCGQPFPTTSSIATLWSIVFWFLPTSQTTWTIE